MRALLVPLLAGLAAPAFAQHSGHSQPSEPAPQTFCAPEHAAMGHCTPPSPAPAAPDPHAEHAMEPAQPAPAADPHAGHGMGTAPAEVPVATPAPVGAPPQSFAEAPPAAPPPRPSSVELVKRAIVGLQDPAHIASALVKLIKDKEPTFVSALRAAGTPDQLLVNELGEDFVFANQDYLNAIGKSFEAQGEAAGIFEDAPATETVEAVPAEVPVQ